MTMGKKLNKTINNNMSLLIRNWIYSLTITSMRIPTIICWCYQMDNKSHKKSSSSYMEAILTWTWWANNKTLWQTLMSNRIWIHITRIKWYLIQISSFNNLTQMTKTSTETLMMLWMMITLKVMNLMQVPLCIITNCFLPLKMPNNSSKMKRIK